MPRTKFSTGEPSSCDGGNGEGVNKSPLFRRLSDRHYRFTSIFSQKPGQPKPTRGYMQCARKDGFRLAWFPIMVAVVSSFLVSASWELVYLSPQLLRFNCFHRMSGLNACCFGLNTFGLYPFLPTSGIFDLCNPMIWSLKLASFASSCSKTSSRYDNFCKVLKGHHMRWSPKRFLRSFIFEYFTKLCWQSCIILSTVANVVFGVVQIWCWKNEIKSKN